MPRLTPDTPRVRTTDTQRVRTTCTPRVRTLRAPRVLLAALLSTGTGAFTLLDAPAAHAAGHQVVMSGYAFSPRSLTINAGDTVTWVNQDTAPHDVKTTSGPASVHSPMLNKGGTWSHTFTAAGSYGYVCTVHPDMTAQLVVKAAVVTQKPKPTTQAPAPTEEHSHSMPSAAKTTAKSTPTKASSAHSSTSTSAPAAGSGAATPSPSGPAEESQPPLAADNTASTGTGRPLDPLLVLAGLVAGIAVLCLLLVGSRSAHASAAPAGGGDGGRKG